MGSKTTVSCPDNCQIFGAKVNNEDKTILFCAKNNKNSGAFKQSIQESEDIMTSEESYATADEISAGTEITITYTIITSEEEENIEEGGGSSGSASSSSTSTSTSSTTETSSSTETTEIEIQTIKIEITKTTIINIVTKETILVFAEMQSSKKKSGDSDCEIRTSLKEGQLPKQKM